MSYDEFVSHLNKRSITISHKCQPSCSLKQKLNEIFYCKTCIKFMCSQCTQVTVENYFCSQCFTDTLSAQAFQQESKCATCVECPCCFSPLATVSVASNTASTTATPSTTATTTVVTADSFDYVYMCEFCKWNSKSINLIVKKPNGLSARLKELEDQQTSDKPFQELVDNYKQLVRPKKKYQRSSTLVDESKFDVDAALSLGSGASRSSRFQGNLQQAVQQIENELIKKQDSIPSLKQKTTIAENKHVSVVPDRLMDADKFVLSNCTTLEQRLMRPGASPLLSSDLLPRRKALMTKAAYICRTCNKHVIKPKVGASHVALDLNAHAISFVPTITISYMPVLKFQEQTNAILYFRNPLATEVEILLTETQPASATCHVAVPTSSFIVAPYDELAEQEDEMGQSKPHSYKDNPDVVAQRHLNKIGVHISVLPLSKEQPVEFSIVVRLQSKNKDVSQYDQLSYVVFVNLGYTDDALVTPTISILHTTIDEQKSQ